MFWSARSPILYQRMEDRVIYAMDHAQEVSGCRYVGNLCVCTKNL